MSRNQADNGSDAMTRVRTGKRNDEWKEDHGFTSKYHR